LAGFILFPATASADRLTFIGRCPGCNAPLYGQTVVAGYNRYGQPIVQTIPVAHSCPATRYGYGRSDNHRGSYKYDRGPRPRPGFSLNIYR
jgi:hypothetical protein